MKAATIAIIILGTVTGLLVIGSVSGYFALSGAADDRVADKNVEIQNLKVEIQNLKNKVENPDDPARVKGKLWDNLSTLIEIESRRKASDMVKPMHQEMAALQRKLAEPIAEPSVAIPKK